MIDGDTSIDDVSINTFTTAFLEFVFATVCVYVQ